MVFLDHHNPLTGFSAMPEVENSYEFSRPTENLQFAGVTEWLKVPPWKGGEAYASPGFESQLRRTLISEDYSLSPFLSAAFEITISLWTW